MSTSRVFGRIVIFFSAGLMVAIIAQSIMHDLVVSCG